MTVDAQPSARPGSRGTAVAGVLLLGAAVAVATGVYAKVHEPAGKPLFDLGFSGTLPMKAWLTTAAVVLALVQLTSALWMWGRLPGAGAAPGWIGPLHRWSGTTAFVLTLPVAFTCVWSLGFATGEPRVVAHGIAGCAFYGAYAAKMLSLRVRGMPGWALPVLGSLVLSSLVALWLTASLWFFTQSGIPHV
ncbi:DUF6529 family protein [Candidatus Frankia nodulisporulans]|uniref:DUF6529 family protein n=1 Tax=Candidatus Frankia nodulisporulans TaxID=2060052 RepID=UPI0013D88322|nr:DUF6529 family protein [Candidatus Frankia nodulisporulans]